MGWYNQELTIEFTGATLLAVGIFRGMAPIYEFARRMVW
jgi:hypothetical protein